MKTIMGLLMGLTANNFPYSPLRARRRSSAALWARALAVIGLAIMASAPGFSAGLPAEQILAKVAETYRDLDSFRSLIMGSTYVSGPSVPTASSEEWVGGVETRVAESEPGKVRVSNKDLTFVSDGATTWLYLPGSVEYEEVKAAPLLREAWRFCPARSCAGLDYVWVYAHPVPRATGAVLRGEQTLSIGGRQVDCYVISVPVSYRILMQEPQGASEELWVDKSQFIVRRDQFNAGFTTDAASVRGHEPGYAYSLQVLDPGAEPEQAFRFDPPAGVKRVDSMGDHVSDLQLSLGAFDLPEASIFPPPEGRRAPDFTLHDLNGKDFRVQDWRGKTVVLDFWASWCKPCLQELAAIQKLHDEFASSGVVFLGIDDESPETIRAFVKAHGYTFPILLDSDQAVHQLYAVRWAPTTVVINRKDKIAAQYIGAGGETQLLKALKAAGLKIPAGSHGQSHPD